MPVARARDSNISNVNSLSLPPQEEGGGGGRSPGDIGLVIDRNDDLNELGNPTCYRDFYITFYRHSANDAPRAAKETIV